MTLRVIQGRQGPKIVPPPPYQRVIWDDQGRMTRILRVVPAHRPDRLFGEGQNGPVGGQNRPY